MASKRIDISVNGKDNTKGAFSSAAKGIDKMKDSAQSAGQAISQGITKGSTTASQAIGKMGSTASSAFGKISSGASAAGKKISDAFSGLDGTISGLVGSLGAYEIAQAAWTGAATADFNKQFLATKMSTQAANDYVKSIQNIVAAVPGPDTWMNNLLSGAVQKQTDISNESLSQLGKTAADYYLTATGMGKSSIETQQDLMEYIKTGNTSQMERDSIVKDQLDTLKGQATVEDRIKALQTAMIADGYDGVSQLKTASNYWEQFNGLIGKSATTLGNMVLPTISAVLSWLIQADDSTKGWSTNLIVIGGLLVGMVSSIGLIAGPLSSMISIWKTIGSGIVNATARLWEYIAAEKVAGSTSTGGVGGATAKQAAGAVAIGLPVISSLVQVQDEFKKTGDAARAANAGISGFFFGLLGSTDDFSKRQKDALQQDLTFRAQLRQTWSSITSGISNAGNSMRTSFGGATSYIRGAWSNTVSWIRSGANSAAAAANGAWNWIRNGAQSAFSAAGSAWGSLQGWVSQGAHGVVSVAYGSIQGAISAVWSLYSALQSVVGRVWTAVVNTVTGPRGPGGSYAPRGPSGPLDGINFHYENYGGWKKNAWTGANSMSGNCADMTTGLIGRFGGSMVSGTWNGNPHVWWKSPDGKEYDPARKALNGTFTPPPRGPSGSGDIYVFNAGVYGFDDFQKKVEQANDKTGRRLF